MDKSDTLFIKRLKITNMFFMIIQLTSGVLMFTNNSVYWSTICYMIAVIFQCLILLSRIAISETNNIFMVMYEKGVFMFMYILIILGIYVYCIGNSLDNIKENTMPYQWSWYAWIIAILVLLFITPILNIQVSNAIEPSKNPSVIATGNVVTDTIAQNLDIKNNQHNGIIVCHFIFIFVYIQYIISTFYQTDGFRV